ncbi:50S ribosomal protein L18 [bacterium]|jgi:large subunit ribosomal protein L18|nr:50S ribosomal protein L18 [bacterium]
MPNPSKERRERRRRIHSRIRLQVRGQTGKPRLCVAFTGKHIYAQVIDDVAGKTLAAVASTQEAHKGSKPNIKGAAQLGKVLAEKASSKGISTVVFDRGGFLYQGKVKAFADAARQAGLKF